jgi:hypothetical protein
VRINVASRGGRSCQMASGFLSIAIATKQLCGSTLRARWFYMYPEQSVCIRECCRCCGESWCDGVVVAI